MKSPENDLVELLWQLIGGIPWYAILLMGTCGLVGRFVIYPILAFVRPSLNGNAVASMFVLMLAALFLASVALFLGNVATAEPLAMIAFLCFILGTLTALLGNR